MAHAKTIYGFTEFEARQYFTALEKCLPFLPEGLDPEYTQRLHDLKTDLEAMMYGKVDEVKPGKETP